MTGGYLRQGLWRLGVEATRLRFQLRRSHRALDPSRVAERIPADPAVLFLCYGNICRSPFAERYARARSDGSARFSSTGFHETVDRPSPEVAVDVARNVEVDLRDHRSDRIRASAVAAADLLLVMDVRNYRRLAAEFPEALAKAWFLKPFGPDDGLEIADPYDGGRAAFETAYRDVTRAVDGLLTTLDCERPGMRTHPGV